MLTCKPCYRCEIGRIPLGQSMLHGFEAQIFGSEGPEDVLARNCQEHIVHKAPRAEAHLYS